jgi:hypothetical protein
VTGRVALATSSRWPELFQDDRPLPPALAALGVDAVPAVWDDPAVDWDAFDLVVVRSTWDYVPRREQFLAWARAVPRLANPAEVVAWNTDKRYLRDLTAAGVPVVPTQWVSPGDAYDPPAGEHVVKPIVSAGARDTARHTDAAGSRAHVARLLADGRAVMVQPYQSAIETSGETSVVHLGGRYSHAACKAPVLVPDLHDPDEVQITGREPSEAERALAEAAVAAVPGGPLLFARVDMVPGPDGSPVVMELELTEPCLFLGTAPGSAERLAQAVLEQVRRTAG